MKVENPVLPGFNPDPSLSKQERIIILPPLHSSGFQECVFTTPGIW